MSQTPEQRVERAITALAELAEPDRSASAALERPAPGDPALSGLTESLAPVAAPGPAVEDAPEPALTEPEPDAAGVAASGPASPAASPDPAPASAQPDPSAPPGPQERAASGPPEPAFDAAAARDAELARQQLRRAGWALLTPATSPDDAVAAALLSSPELWRGLEEAGVSVTEFGRRWSASRQPGTPERRVAQIAELSVPERDAGRAFREGLIRDLAGDVRRRVVRWQAAQRSAELQATLVRSFQAAGALPASGSSVNQAAERAAAQRARLELVRLSTEVEAERRALASVMGLPERNDQWAPAAGPPDVPLRLGPGRAEIGVDEAIARALRDRADIAEVRRQVQASDPRSPGRAGFEAREARRRLADLEAAARAQVREAHGRMAGARLVAEAAREAILPMHERIVDVSLDRFNAGLVDASELVAAQRELVAARRQQTDALRDYWIARIDLDRAMGL